MTALSLVAVNPTVLPLTPSGDIAAVIGSLRSGQTLDLGGNTFDLTSPLTVTASNVKIVNGTLSSGDFNALRVAADDVTVENISFSRLVTAAAGDSLADRSLVTVAARRFKSLECSYTNANLACLYLANGVCEGAVIRGGYWQNSNNRQNSCFVYVASGSAINERITVEGIYGQGTGCSDGILVFDASHCRVEGNVVRDLVAPTDIDWTSGWTNVSGNVYSHVDRADGNTRVVFNNAVQMTVENTATPTAPGANEWGVSGGLFYLNLSGTDPSTVTITSRITGGYGITFYHTTADLLNMDENLVAHNEVRNVDGFGCYWQISSTDARNQGIGNRYYNVCRKGLQNNNLPFGGVGVSRGLNTSLIGERVYTCAYHAFNIANSGTGRAVGCHAENATGGNFDGFRIRTSDWTCDSCSANNNAEHGFGVVSSTGDSLSGIRILHCTASGNTKDGCTIENISGTDIKASVVGGEYFSNGQRGVSVDIASDTNVVGVKAHDNGPGVPQIRISGACVRVLVDDCIVYGSSGTGIEIKSAVLSAILGKNYSSTTTPYNIEIAVQISGSAIPTFVGTGTPEAAVTAPIGSLYQRKDGGASTSLYVKESGTGNTGWVAK